MDIKEFASLIGRDEIARTLGVWPTAVGNQVAKGEFPASWYWVVKDLADRKNADCPVSLFNFKSPSDAPAQEAEQ